MRLGSANNKHLVSWGWAKTEKILGSKLNWRGLTVCLEDKQWILSVCTQVKMLKRYAPPIEEDMSLHDKSILKNGIVGCFENTCHFTK